MDKQEILSLIKEKPSDAIKELSRFEKDVNKINDYKKEYVYLNRNLRETQVDRIQKDKIIKKEKGPEKVKAVRTPINFQKKIVSTSTAFEFGNPVEISPNNPNDLTKSALNLWYDTRLDSKLQELSKFTKSETESCIVFYITGQGEQRKLRSKVYSSEDGKMVPYFDNDDDLTFFTWKFSKTEGEKKVKYYWVYDEKNIYQFKESNEGYSLEDTVPHGFDKIPVVYDCQKQVEYEDVKKLIDRYEVALSKLGSANDYTGHPILMINGEVKGMPDKDDSGKVLKSDIQIDRNTGKELTGRAQFLSYDNAPESVKLELEQLRDFIGYITSTPDLSFNTLKSLGNVATETLQLMFLDPILKAKLNEGRNRTIVQRCLKIIESGLVNTLQTRLSSSRNDSRYNIKFTSILPNNLTELMKNLVSGSQARIVSQETAVNLLGLTNDNENEIKRIKENEKVNTISEN